MSFKRKRVLWAVLLPLALAVVVPIIKMVTEEHKQTILPMVSAVWTWLIGVYESLMQMVQTPLWLLIVVATLAVVLVAFLSRLAWRLAADLKEANLKLNPTLPPLDESALKVLKVIAEHEGDDQCLYVSEVQQTTELSPLLYKGALDDLNRWELISIVESKWGDHMSLSAPGRAYVRHEQSPLSSLAV